RAAFPQMSEASQQPAQTGTIPT
ncbi:MAG: hypothetical protein JWM74_2261, partial [Myxococcaceae bacterium]|nr:hypothetical protein [Myxococcaceae bacterium]